MRCSDWGQRFPEDNEDVILRECPFSMSQVRDFLIVKPESKNKILPRISRTFLASRVPIYSVLSNPPKSLVRGKSLGKSRNPFANNLWQHQITKPLLYFKYVSVVKAELVGPGAEGANTYVTLKLQSVKSTTVPVKGKKPTWNQDFLL